MIVTSIQGSMRATVLYIDLILIQTDCFDFHHDWVFFPFAFDHWLIT